VMIVLRHRALLTSRRHQLPFRPMRRAVVLGLLTLGILLALAAPASAQTATTGPPTSTSASTTSTALKTAGGPGAEGSSRLPTLGEGFPWITVGAVILVAGLVGARLRRGSRR
jgi:hypothetical protein